MRITVPAPFSCKRSESPVAAKEASRISPSSPGFAIGTSTGKR